MEILAEQDHMQPDASGGFITILLIEDNEDDAIFLRELMTEEILRENDSCEPFHLIHCTGLSDGLEKAEQNCVDLIMLDLGLAESSGLETLQRLSPATNETPIVVLSGLADKAVAVEALRNGAQDYLVKGQVQSETLWRCIQYAMERQRLKEQIKQHAEKARAAEERFRRLIEVNCDGMLIVDNKRRICLANPAAEHFFGQSADALAGENFRHSICADGTTEITFDRPDDSPVTAECRPVPIIWEDKEAHLISMRDITERKDLEKRLYHLANYDPLTEIYNRRVFFERLSHETARTCRYGHPLSVLIIDIDRFKRINDAYGHQTGDMVLMYVAELCQQCLRATDTLGRIGGEEFGVILPHTGMPGARKAGERLREGIEETRVETSRISLSITVTIGVATAEGLCDTDQLMDQADKALYRGKNAGRNLVVSA